MYEKIKNSKNKIAGDRGTIIKLFCQKEKKLWDTIVTITTNSKLKINSSGNEWCSIGMNQTMIIVTILSGVGQNIAGTKWKNNVVYVWSLDCSIGNRINLCTATASAPRTAEEHSTEASYLVTQQQLFVTPIKPVFTQILEFVFIYFGIPTCFGFRRRW